MLATGNSSVEAINLIKKYGVKTSNIKFVSLLVNAGSIEKHEAAVSLEVDGEKKSTTSFGNGPVDGTFNAIKKLQKLILNLNYIKCMPLLQERMLKAR